MRNILAELVKRLRLENDIVFTGKLSEEEKLQAIAASEILVLPSRKEAQGIVLLEAQALGKPVIATRQGGIPYFIEDRENGLLVDYGKPEQIANAVSALLCDTNLRKKIERKAKETARRLTWDIISQKILDCYQLTLKEHRIRIPKGKDLGRIWVYRTFQNLKYPSSIQRKSPISRNRLFKHRQLRQTD